MKEVFEYLRQYCLGCESFYKVSHNQLWFDYSNFFIIVEFTKTEEDCDENNEGKFDENFVDISELDFSLFDKKSVNRLYLQSETMLHYLEEEKREYIETNISYTNKNYFIVKCLKKQFLDSITNYSIASFCIDDSCMMCDDVWGYGLQIDINETYWTNKTLFNFIINDIDKNLPDFSIPNFYNTGKDLKDTFELKTLSSNTKIRRLGYLKILLKMLNEQTKIPVSKMNAKFEKYCQNYNSYLEVHKNQKGNVIVTKTGNSANPYIELAISLGLIHKAAGIYQVGKIGKVYNILKDKIDVQNDNPFVFSKFDTTFFLELLLKEDYWFLYAIMEQTAITPNIAYKNLKKEFKQILLTQIGQFIDDAQDNNSKKVLSLKIIERRINDWKKPEVYMEHVLMPRLNWLYDMELIELRNDLSFNLTETGEKLLYSLAIWNDIALHRIVSPLAYIDNYFMKMINFMFDFQKVRWTQNADRAFEEYIDDSFVLFKTLAPNRVTFSMCSNYAKQMLFWNNNGIVDTENIKKVFEAKQIPCYIYKYQEHYKDGYIQKSK